MSEPSSAGKKRSGRQEQDEMNPSAHPAGLLSEPAAPHAPRNTGEQPPAHAPQSACLAGEGRESASLVTATCQIWQDHMGLLLTTQRRLVALWLESFYGLLLPRLFLLQGLEVTPPAGDDEDREARAASALILG